MNINQLIYQIKSSAGLNGYIKSSITDKHIKEIIEEVTLPFLSSIWPFELEIRGLDLKGLERVHGYPPQTYAFKIPSSYMNKLREYGVEIIGIQQTSHIDYMRNTYRRERPFTQGYSYAHNIDALYHNMIKDNIFELNIFTFESPDIFSFNTDYDRNYDIDSGYGYIDLKLKCTHPTSLSTISNSMLPVLLRLAKYDVMIDLYQNKLKDLKINIGNASVDLKIDVMESAYRDREEYVKELEESGRLTETFTLAW